MPSPLGVVYAIEYAVLKKKNGGEDQVLTVAYVLADIERSLPSIPIPASPKTEEKNRYS